MMTTPETLSHAERQRRYRQRQAESRDEVRTFLTAVIASAEAAAADPDVTVEPFQLRNADTARDHLDLLERGAEATRPKLTYRLIGRSDADIERIYAAHERAFERWRVVPGNVPAAARIDAPAVSLAETSLRWAADLLAKGEATSPVLAQGIRAAKRMIVHRQRPAVTDALQRFADITNVRDLNDLVERQWVTRPTEDYLGGAPVAQEDDDDEHTDD